MSKCIRCGSGFLTRRKISLKDSEICGKCFKELGFEKRDFLTASVYEYEKIKDGRAAYYENSRKERLVDAVLSSVSVIMTGGERDLVCTEEEREIFERICSIFPDEDLRLVRVSDNYLTIKRGDWDIVRLKYAPRAKWLMFPIFGSQRHELDGPEYVEDFEAAIQDSLNHAKKYS